MSTSSAALRQAGAADAGELVDEDERCPLADHLVAKTGGTRNGG